VVVFGLVAGQRIIGLAANVLDALAVEKTALVPLAVSAGGKKLEVGLRLPKVNAVVADTVLAVAPRSPSATSRNKPAFQVAPGC
jgi:hypothetical protein